MGSIQREKAYPPPINPNQIILLFERAYAYHSRRILDGQGQCLTATHLNDFALNSNLSLSHQIKLKIPVMVG